MFGLLQLYTPPQLSLGEIKDKMTTESVVIL